MECTLCGHADGGTDNRFTAWVRHVLHLPPKAPRCAFEDEATGDIGGGPACDCQNPAHAY